MNATADIHELVSELKTKGEPFAVATVIRTVSVTSAKAGAKAVILNDGSISGGWIGGGCARAAVLNAARETIQDGQPRLVSVEPEHILADKGISPGEESGGVKYSRNMCPSQGSMDIFVEAIQPRPELVIMGATPVAIALAQLGKTLGFACTVCAESGEFEHFPAADTKIKGFELDESNARRFVVIATQGRGDEKALLSALNTRSEYIAFVGSRKKAASLRSKLTEEHDISADEFDRVKAPAGLDIKAILPEEIALSILAEIVEMRRSGEHAVKRDSNMSETESFQA